MARRGLPRDRGVREHERRRRGAPVHRERGRDHRPRRLTRCVLVLGAEPRSRGPRSLPRWEGPLPTRVGHGPGVDGRWGRARPDLHGHVVQLLPRPLGERRSPDRRAPSRARPGDPARALRRHTRSELWASPPAVRHRGRSGRGQARRRLRRNADRARRRYEGRSPEAHVPRVGARVRTPRCTHDPRCACSSAPRRPRAPRGHSRRDTHEPRRSERPRRGWHSRRGGQRQHGGTDRALRVARAGRGASSPTRSTRTSA